jgi:signal transduction histidine kinase
MFLPSRHGGWLIASMALALALVAGLSYGDAQREWAAALDDFAQEQASLAQAAGAELATRLQTAPREAGEARVSPGFLLQNLRALERPGERKVLLISPEGTRAGDEGPLPASLTEALRTRSSGARLARPEAASIGLPARLALAGISTVDGKDLGRWTVAVVSSARRVRDREQHASLRLWLSVLLGGAVVFGFGTLALRRQRQELELQHELAVAALRRRRDERLVRASRLATMGTFASGVAHEISTPLGVIAGRAEQLLPRVGGDERARKAVQIIADQAERIGEVVRGFLDLSRGGKPTITQAQPEVLVGGAVRLVEHRFQAAGVAIEVDLPPSLPPLACDSRLLEHALVNLLLNACEACEAGGHVAIRVRTSDTGLAFLVEDDGPGISPEVVARATEPFFTTKGDGKGTGLGLAITQEIVKMHRGQLSLAPQAPSGTRASIDLPLAPGAPHDET